MRAFVFCGELTNVPLKGPTKVDTDGNFNFNPLPWPVTCQTSLSFSVSGCVDFCIYSIQLSAVSSADPSQTFEVDISAFASISTVATISAPTSDSTAGALEFSSSYWVNWTTDTLTVGSGGTVGQGPQLSYTSTSPIVVISATFASGLSPISYSVLTPGLAHFLFFLRWFDGLSCPSVSWTYQLSSLGAVFLRKKPQKTQSDRVKFSFFFCFFCQTREGGGLCDGRSGKLFGIRALVRHTCIGNVGKGLSRPNPLKTLY